MRRGAVERIEDRGARGAWRLGKWELRRLAAGGSRSRITRVAGEHEAVNDERVLTGREQLREPDLSAYIGRLEAIVLRDAAERQRAPARRDALDRPPELDLCLKQSIAFTAVLVRLAGEANVMVNRQDPEST